MAGLLMIITGIGVILFPYRFSWLSLIFTIYFSDVMVCLD